MGSGQRLDLRAQSESLTRQMWLLYATFEDVICINHPHRAAALLATSVDIDHYLHRPVGGRNCPPVSEDKKTGIRSRKDNALRRKRIIGCDHQGLKDPVGCYPSNVCRSDKCVACRCGSKLNQQSSKGSCLDRQQIASVGLVSLDVSVSYRTDFENNDQSSCLVGCKGFGVDGHFPNLGHVEWTKGVIRRRTVGRGSCKVTGDTTSRFFAQNPKTNDLDRGRVINDPLNNRNTGLFLDKESKVIRHSALMRSVSAKRTGQFMAGSSLVSRANRHGLSSHASLNVDSDRGFESAKELNRHTFNNHSDEMNAGPVAVQPSAWCPRNDYSLARAVPGHRVIQPVSRSPTSPEWSRRPVQTERVAAKGQSSYMHQIKQTSPGYQSDMLSVITQTGYTRQVHNRPDTIYRSERAGRRMNECRSGRKSSPIADDTQLSPVTISSGYESDSIPSPVQPELDKFRSCVNTDDDHTDYFSQSDTYPKSVTRDIQTQQAPSGTLPLKVRSKQAPFVPTLGKSRFVRFGQHHNAILPSSRPGQPSSVCLKQSHKLAKVTRSMYAIIHDLQHENASRKMRRHSCDAVKENRECRCEGGRVSMSPIFSPELRSRADVLVTQSESEENLHVRYQDTKADDTPTRTDSSLNDSSFVSSNERYSQIRKQQCAMSGVTQRLFNMDMREQSAFKDDNIKPADRADDNHRLDQVMRGSPRQGAKYSKTSEAQSDNEHIYEVIPGDESVISTQGLVSCENTKLALAKWTTVGNLETSPEIPPALPERKYTGKKMDPPIPPRCVKVCNNSVSNRGERSLVMCDSSNQDYAIVCKTKSFDNVSLDGYLGRIDDCDVLSDLDSELYARVCPPQPRQRNTFDFSDLTSETYCRLDPVKQVQEIDQWSSGDVLNFIDGIHEHHNPKTRANIYTLLQNSKTRAKFSESLEIETQLLHKGLLCNPWREVSDDVTEPMTSEAFQRDFRHEIQPTYV
ncbi:uncharacterized protein LOC124134874 isoform X2 [Haliotis rufescens]|uniref:uncharacterized protein LOC124134874 isoform X2 n=1 Tax=Haliotis rufescens TaxID=6454 RepID=UPI00201E867C|nr:uncharacterized protein LOC124134874 isoform X2 [Haliotis rufescens]